MEKKYKEEADRLRRFIYARCKTVEEFSEETGISADSLRTTYINGRSILGGEMMKRLLPFRFNPIWYLTGYGIAPDPSEDEIAAHVEQLKTELEYWSTFYANIQQAKDEIAQKMREHGVKSAFLKDDKLAIKAKFKPRRKK